MKYKVLSVIIAVFLLTSGCFASHSVNRSGFRGIVKEGYSIQVGAFNNPHNAGRYVDSLIDKGLDAFMFRDGSLYKVRFGNYKTFAAAEKRAKSLYASGRIGKYYIVKPESYALYKSGRSSSKGRGSTYLRNEIVKTAFQYIGTPYVWGGDTAAGFDCSGLTRAVYRLNGLSIPRVSGEQFRAGKPVRRDRLKKGDLVFFATAGGRRVSHVGIYVGDDTFLHAPRKGTTVRTDRLSNKYWSKVYLGARSYTP